MVDRYVYYADGNTPSTKSYVVSVKCYGNVVLAVAAVSDVGSDEW